MTPKLSYTRADGSVMTLQGDLATITNNLANLITVFSTVHPARLCNHCRCVLTARCWRESDKKKGLYRCRTCENLECKSRKRRAKAREKLR